MNFNGLSSIEHHLAPSNGWSSCLTKGDATVWIAGGPGIGLIGYALSSQAGADAAVSFELGKLDQQDEIKQGELWSIVRANRPQFEIEFGLEIDAAPGFPIISIWFETTLYGHVVSMAGADGCYKVVGGPFPDFIDAVAHALRLGAGYTS